MKQESKNKTFNKKSLEVSNKDIDVHEVKVNVIYSENGMIFIDILKRYLKELKNGKVI